MGLRRVQEHLVEPCLPRPECGSLTRLQASKQPACCARRPHGGVSDAGSSAQMEPGSARKVRHAAEGVGALGEDPLAELANDIDREIDQREVGLFKCDLPPRVGSAAQRIFRVGQIIARAAKPQ